MVNVSTQTIIDRPIEKVFAFASNPENAPKWYVNIKSAEWVSKGDQPIDKTLKVGSHIAFKAQFLGKELSYTYEIVELIKDQRLVMRTAQGPFPMETTYIFDKVSENKTRMTLINQGNPTGFSKLFAPFMSMAMKRATTKDLALLKEILEKQ
jgi:uncharacterized membrane protein